MNEQTTWSPDLDAGDARADLLDDPGALVAEHHRQPRLEVAVRDVHVGVAQARRGCSGSAPRPPAARRGRAPRSRSACRPRTTTAALVFMRGSSGWGQLTRRAGGVLCTLVLCAPNPSSKPSYGAGRHGKRGPGPGGLRRAWSRAGAAGCYRFVPALVGVCGASR